MGSDRVFEGKLESTILYSKSKDFSLWGWSNKQRSADIIFKFWFCRIRVCIPNSNAKTSLLNDDKERRGYLRWKREKNEWRWKRMKGGNCLWTNDSSWTLAEWSRGEDYRGYASVLEFLRTGLYFRSEVLLMIEWHDETQYHCEYKEKGWFEPSLCGWWLDIFKRICRVEWVTSYSIFASLLKG